MAVHSPNTPEGVRATGLPAHHRTCADEFLALCDQHRAIGRRLNELAENLGPSFGVRLPKSGLQLVAVSAKGGLAMEGRIAPADFARGAVSQPRLLDLIARERLRTRIEETVARLIDALDAIDGDADLEDTDDAEAVNEDGGNILDEPEDDVEPNSTGVYGNSGVRAHA